MTSHALATLLLSGPDLPIFAPFSSGDARLFDPIVIQEEGEDPDENAIQILVVSHKPV